MLSGQKSNEDLIRALAATLAQRGWRAPAMVLLEMLKPFSFIGSQAMLLFEPLLSPLLGGQARRYATLLEERANIERLLEALEAEPGR